MSEELSSADVSDTPLPLAGGDEGLTSILRGSRPWWWTQWLVVCGDKSDRMGEDTEGCRTDVSDTTNGPRIAVFLVAKSANWRKRVCV